MRQQPENVKCRLHRLDIGRKIMRGRIINDIDVTVKCTLLLDNLVYFKLYYITKCRTCKYIFL